MFNAIIIDRGDVYAMLGGEEFPKVPMYLEVPNRNRLEPIRIVVDVENVVIAMYEGDGKETSYSGMEAIKGYLGVGGF